MSNIDMAGGTRVPQTVIDRYIPVFREALFAKLYIVAVVRDVSSRKLHDIFFDKAPLLKQIKGTQA
jgi:hypothetical protein